jgi:hypothetical protein
MTTDKEQDDIGAQLPDSTSVSAINANHEDSLSAEERWNEKIRSPLGLNDDGTPVTEAEIKHLRKLLYGDGE